MNLKAIRELQCCFEEPLHHGEKITNTIQFIIIETSVLYEIIFKIKDKTNIVVSSLFLLCNFSNLLLWRWLKSVHIRIDKIFIFKDILHVWSEYIQFLSINMCYRIIKINNIIMRIIVQYNQVYIGWIRFVYEVVGNCSCFD